MRATLRGVSRCNAVGFSLIVACGRHVDYSATGGGFAFTDHDKYETP